MHSLEILKKLRKLKTTKAKQNLLHKIPEYHPFWYCAWHALDAHKISFPFLSELKDPLYFGDGAPAEVFNKMMLKFVDMKITSSELVKTLGVFSERCTAEEWVEWYKPLVLGKLIMPLSPEEFLEVAPGGFRLSMGITKFNFKKIENSRITVFPRAIEPYPEAQRAFWYIGSNGAVAFLPDGRRVEHPLLEEASELFNKTRSNMVLDLYMESEEILIVRDLIYADIFFNDFGPKNQTIKTREEGLEQVVNVLWSVGITGAEMIERYHVEPDASLRTIRDNAQMFLEQGYPGFVFVERSGLVLEDIPVVAHPTKKSVVTCLDIISGEDQYEGKAEYIQFRGMIGGRKVLGRTYYGLTWEQRDTYFRDRDNFIGKRFEILSCGTNEDGVIITPIFKQWRK